MLIGKKSREYICTHCRRRRLNQSPYPNGQSFHQAIRLPQQTRPSIKDEAKMDEAEEAEEMRREVGRMTERLVQMTEESIEQGGRGAKKAVEEAGFSDQLKKQLEGRLKGSSFQSENAAAFAEINMPVRSMIASSMPMLNPI